MGRAASPIVDAFIEFARRYSREERAQSHARSNDRGTDRLEAALSMKVALEHEFKRCFDLKAAPNFDNVEAAARGEFRGERR